MSRMLELIRASAVTSHQMMSAAKGALRVPPAETLEILVYLAEHNKIFGGEARLTLAGWDEAASKQVANDPACPREVLEYWISAKNIRPALFPILLENPSVPISKLAELAGALQGELIDVMIASPRVRNSVQLLHDMSTNHNLSGTQSARVQALINGTAYEELEADRQVIQAEQAKTEAEENPEPASISTCAPVTLAEDASPADPETEKAVVAFIAEHAAEISAEPQKPFQPIGGIHEEEYHTQQPQAAAAVAAAVPGPAPAQPTSNPYIGKALLPKKSLINPEDERRGSVLQKIAKLDVKGRIQLAMKGTKEERSILVRDGTKIVALAVLDSPKITDGEVEKFATQKNVLEAVLRAIPMKRRFAKNYAVLRNLVFNPRTPLDVTLGLMKNLLVADLRNLAGNKEVPDTVNKLALRMFKQKSESSKKN